MIVSPARRAQETARALGRSFETIEALAPGGDVASLLKLAGWPDAERPVLVVGHQPTLGETAAQLIDGRHASWRSRHWRGVVVAEPAAQGPRRGRPPARRSSPRSSSDEGCRATFARAWLRCGPRISRELRLDARGVARSHAQQQLAARRFRLERGIGELVEARSAARARSSPAPPAPTAGDR